jgi:nitrate/nitrite transport system substrate-binding protein
MIVIKDPFDPNVALGAGCNCGHHASQAEHDAAHAHDDAATALQGVDTDSLMADAVENAVMRGVFGFNDASRRAFLQAVGKGTALAALASVFPLDAARSLAAEGGAKPEKTKLKVGFVPITCATPIIMAHPMGFYKKHGLDVDVIKTPAGRSRATSRCRANTTHRTC